jgi:hypothetical protein
MVVAPNRATVAVIGFALFAATIVLGWWSAEGAHAARSGLKLGAIPMAAAIATVAVEGWCDPNRTITICGLGCLAAGMFAGAASAWYAVRTQPPRQLRVWSQIGLVASLTTALGCVGLGFGSALAVLGAVALGAAVAWVPIRATKGA